MPVPVQLTSPPVDTGVVDERLGDPMIEEGRQAHGPLAGAWPHVAALGFVVFTWVVCLAAALVMVLHGWWYVAPLPIAGAVINLALYLVWRRSERSRSMAAKR